MQYRKLDDNGDYMLGRRNQFLIDSEAVAQAIQTRLRLLLGEWWENTEDGLPLFQEILNTFHATDYRAESIDLLFSERILETRGVSRMISFDSAVDMSSRIYSASCEIETMFGDIVSIQITGNSNGQLNIVNLGG